MGETFITGNPGIKLMIQLPKNRNTSNGSRKRVASGTAKIAISKINIAASIKFTLPPFGMFH